MTADDAERSAADVLFERVKACARYAEELNRLELPPNGDDFNVLLDLLAGKPYRAPSARWR